MAKTKTEIKRAHFDWGWRAEGKKEDLIAAKLAKRDWFATRGKRDPSGRVVRTKKLTHKGREITTTAKGNTYVLQVHYSEAERKSDEIPDDSSSHNIQIKYGERTMRFRVGSISPNAILRKIINGRLPIAFDSNAKPVYFDWDKHGRYAVAEDGVIKFRRWRTEMALPFKVCSGSAT